MKMRSDHNSPISSEDDKQLITILSIDGGGIRGVIPTVILQNLEDELQKLDGPKARIADYFDVIAGTSTGSILTALLTDPDNNKCPRHSTYNILTEYEELVPDVFNRSRKSTEERKRHGEKAAKCAREAADKLGEAQKYAMKGKARAAIKAAGKIAKEGATTLAHTAAEKLHEVARKDSTEVKRNGMRTQLKELAGKAEEAYKILSEANGKDIIDSCKKAKVMLRKAADEAREKAGELKGKDLTDELLGIEALLKQAAHDAKQAKDGLSNQLAENLGKRAEKARRMASMLWDEKKIQLPPSSPFFWAIFPTLAAVVAYFFADFSTLTAFSKLDFKITTAGLFFTFFAWFLGHRSPPARLFFWNKAGGWKDIVFSWFKKKKKRRNTAGFLLGRFSKFFPIPGRITPFDQHLRLQETVKDVVVPTFGLEDHSPFIFSSFMARDLDRGYEHIYLEDVVKSSTAAPLFFPAHRFRIMGEERQFIDGGLAANNPSLVALLEARRRLGNPNKKYLVLSLGTGRGITLAEITKSLKYFFMTGNILRLVLLILSSISLTVDMEEIYMSRFFHEKDGHYYLRIQDNELPKDAITDPSTSNFNKLKEVAKTLLCKNVTNIDALTGEARKIRETNRTRLEHFARVLSKEKTRRDHTKKENSDVSRNSFWSGLNLFPCIKFFIYIILYYIIYLLT